MRFCLAVLLLFAGCPAPGPVTPRVVTVPPAKPAPPPPGTIPPGALPPKLVVLFIVDQLPQWAFTAKRPALTGGFDRLLREGEWITGVHPSAATRTAPGHALLGTGAPPSVSGIIGNTWWDRDAQVVVDAVRDAKGVLTTAHLRVSGLGDAMAAANTGGKAIAISLKERASILPLGHAGTAIWYDSKAIAWASLAPVPWLAEYNRTHPIKPRLTEVWNPLDAAQLATLSGVVDGAPGEVGDKGFGTSFPHDPAATKNPAATVYASPLGNELVLETATAALDAEQLGADDAADLLVISLSANDYIGHAWGQESWEAWDSMLRIDRRLATFLDALDAHAGAGRWALIATSDHGASPMPEGTITYPQLKDAANKAAATELGTGDWIADATFPHVFLTKSALAQKDVKKALRKIIFALRSFPGMGNVVRTADVAGRCEQRTGEARLLCLAVDPQRAGELTYVPAAGWVFGSDTLHATAHGGYHAYDREVPVLLLSPGRVPHDPLATPSDTRIGMEEIAAVLARWLGIAHPRDLPR